MQGRWLHQSGREEAVVVFGGWAVGPAPFIALPQDREVYFVEDYRTLDAELPDLSGYEAVDLLAWSFGVAAFGHWQQGRTDVFRRKVALCGSPVPVDRRNGIAPLAYRRTVEGLSTRSFQQFLERVFNLAQPDVAIDVAARRDELIAVQERGAAPHVTYDQVWIAAQDQIFPPKNLQQVWQGQSVKMIDSPHAPFAHFRDWEDFFK